MHDAQAEALAASGIAFTATLSIFDMVSSETGEPILEDAIANTCRLYRAGLPMAVGTDFMFENPPYQTVGIPVHEFRLLHRAGLSVNEILLAATEGSAQVCGVSEETGQYPAGQAGGSGSPLQLQLTKASRLSKPFYLSCTAVRS